MALAGQIGYPVSANTHAFAPRTVVLGNYGGIPFNSHHGTPAVTTANQSVALQSNQSAATTAHATTTHATTAHTASTQGHLTYTTQQTQQQVQVNPEQLTSYLQPAHGQIGTQTALLTLPNGYQ